MKTPAQNYVESATRRLTLRLHNQPYVVLIALLVLFVLPAHSQVTNIQPTFDMGSDAGLSSGQASAAKNIGTLLHVSDMDRGQLLTWSVINLVNTITSCHWNSNRISCLCTFWKHGDCSRCHTISILGHIV